VARPAPHGGSDPRLGRRLPPACTQPNRLAEWELRVERFRVFYDIDEVEAMVRIQAIGHKRGNRLYLRSEEFQL
jgi:hypothetical protein